MSFAVGVEYKNSHLQKVGCGANTPEQGDFLISLLFFVYVVVEGKTSSRKNQNVGILSSDS